MAVVTYDAADKLQDHHHLQQLKWAAFSSRGNLEIERS